ncbi:FkbM family methyltransferase [Thalassobaculum sp.]|uniref:FkbM family methyltransferase n=1 Tax=Thalassobaculum sp. TaxID=2022740 RepID=UPI0032F04B23
MTDFRDDPRKVAAYKRAQSYEKALPVLKIHNGPNTVRLVTPSQFCVWRAFTYFDKEPETINWIAGIPENGVLFDVGANIGLYTLWAGLTRNANVFAFEPESSNYATLNSNLRANELTDRCRAFCTGVSDKCGFDTLRVGRVAIGASGHQVGTRHTGGTAQGIVTTTLDHLVYEAGLPCPSHVKIDVDGIEPAIVRGAARLLSDERLKSVLIELSIMEPDHRAVVDQLVDYGFTKDEALEKAVYAKTTGVKHTGNIIFTRP